jgi:hypothetical protein
VLRNLLRILQHLVAVAILAGVFTLGFDVGAHDLERGQFVLADATVEQLVLARRGVEEPRPSFFTMGTGKGQELSPISSTHLASDSRTIRLTLVRRGMNCLNSLAA